MSAGDLAAILVAVVTLAAVVVLTGAALALVRTVRDLRHVVDDLRTQAVPMVGDLRAAVAHADAELDRVAGLLDQGEEIGAHVEATSRLANRAFAPPIIKTLSLAAGVRRATRRLRGLGDGAPIEARTRSTAELALAEAPAGAARDADRSSTVRPARRRARRDPRDRPGSR